MSIDAIVFCGLGAFFVISTVGCAMIARHLTRSDKAGIIAGGLAFPLLTLAGLFYWLATMEVDDPPPGAVIIANLALTGLALPLTFLMSLGTVCLLARRARASGG